MLTRAYPADSSLNVAFAYDQAGHGDGIGRLTSLTYDQAGSLSRSYEERGLVTSDARVIGGTTYTTAYSYDGAWRIAAETYPTGGWVVGYARDAAGQIKTVTAIQPGHSAVNIATLVKHMPFGPLLSLTWGNGVTDARTFDHAYRTLTIVDTGAAAIQSLTYAYDADDNPHTINDAVTPANNQTLNYDALDRLSSGTGGYSTGAITYDSNSNRLTYGARPVTPTTSAQTSWRPQAAAPSRIRRPAT
jgi:YD repeat-containing protein